MMKVLLITYNNIFYKSSLPGGQFDVVEYHQPPADDIIKEIDDTRYDGTAVIEICGDNINIIKPLIDILNKNSARIIAVGPDADKKIKNFLIDNGIPDFLESASVMELAGCVDAVNRRGAPGMGKIIILDDCGPRIRILSAIIERFSYEPAVVNTIDSLGNRIEAGPAQMILLNLGTGGFDINRFTRKSGLSDAIKKIPVVPYKDMDRGLYIHEVLTGLNRIANIILSTNEVMSFLVETLFRKEFLRAAGRLNAAFAEEEIRLFSQDTLAGIYRTLGAGIFSMKNILQAENLEGLKGIAGSMNGAVSAVRSLRWLSLP